MFMIGVSNRLLAGNDLSITGIKFPMRIAFCICQKYHPMKNKYLGNFSPVAKNFGKYSSKGGYCTHSFRSLNIPTSIVSTLVEAANHSLSHNTWRSYRYDQRIG